MYMNGNIYQSDWKVFRRTKIEFRLTKGLGRQEEIELSDYLLCFPILRRVSEFH